ncbi:MAG: ABC transporter ATP-binding protein [Planctomycetota bacterium]|jgi:branched-chain amino acid transport system ATP-binding protein|nr:ABC transporter ATP-binding protein [Planctomycetota bacterium]
MLRIRGLCAGYHDLKVLFDVDLEVNEGEVVALVGSNGAGKTTLLRTISGIVPLTGGSLEWFGADLTKTPPHARAEMGIAQILQGRGILGTLTVEDNLILGSYTRRTRKRRAQLMERVFAAFPILEKRRQLPAGTLSGGQQQMLAIGRAMMMEPRFLILDEPSLGLAPIVVDEVFRIINGFREAGTSMLLIEQNLVKALQAADRGYVLETGRVQLHGPSRELLDNPAVRKAYLGI